MPSPPSPAADHFEAYRQDVREDSRLSIRNRKLCLRSGGRARAVYLYAPELVQILVCAYLRAYQNLLAASPSAVTTFRGLDAMTRLAARLGLLDARRDQRGLLRHGWTGQGRVRPPTRAAASIHDSSTE